MEGESSLQGDIQRVKKGSASLAEALHKLDLVASFAGRLKQLEKTAQSHEAAIAELREQRQHFITEVSMQVQLDQLSRELRDRVSEQLTEAQVAIDQKLQEFPTRQAVDSALSAKAGGNAVARLHETVKTLNNQFNALNSSVFESFKVEVRRSIASKLDAGAIEESVRYLTESQAWKELLGRVQAAERSVREDSSPVTETNIRSEVSAKDRVELTHMVTETQQQLSLLSESFRQWKADMNEKVEALQQECEKQKSEQGKMLDKVKRQLAHWENKGKPEVEDSHKEEVGAGSPVRVLCKSPRDNDSLARRFVKVETDINNLMLTTEFIKSRQRDKIKDFAKKIQILSEYKDIHSRELAVIHGKLSVIEDTHRRDFADLRQELAQLQGPMVDMLNTKAQETGALNTEIKRHQELFRSFVTDYNYALQTSVTPTVRTSHLPLKPDNLERVHSASPAFKLRKRLHPALTQRKEEDESMNLSFSQPRNRFSFDRRRLSTSRKSTPRRMGEETPSLNHQ